MPTVKPLKRGGTRLPREITASADYLATKGLDIEELGTHWVEKIGGLIQLRIPDCSSKVNYLANGEVDTIEIYEGSNQLAADLRLKISLTYDSVLNPITEVWQIYDPADGTTVLRTITVTNVFDGLDFVSSSEATV